jgi:uncharacterized protein (DUF934 family)
MPDIILNHQVIADDWQIERNADLADVAAIPAGQVLIPLPVWNRVQASLGNRENQLGLWLASTELPDAIQGDITRIPVIAVEFPLFADGRGFSIGYLLRSRYGYAGQLRAIGAPIRDQLTYLKRCGFNAFQLAPHYDLQDALKSLSDFQESYQASFDQPIPLFRRRAN